MNFFEFEDNDFIRHESIIKKRNEEYILMKFDEYCKYSNCDSININFKGGDVTCRQFKNNDCEFLLICVCNVKLEETVIFLYSYINDIWVHKWDLRFSALLNDDGLNVITVEYYEYYSTDSILLVIFRSQLSLHVARVDVHNNKLTDVIAFDQDSIYQPPQSNMIALIVNPNKTISLLLIDQTYVTNAQYCPTVAELQLVLTRRLLSGVQSLLSFWVSQLTDIKECCAQNPHISLVHGISLLHYITFLRIHKSVLLSIITNHCRSDTSLHGVSNTFLEHITNMINVYLKEAVNLVISIQFIYQNDDTVREALNAMLDMLCDYCRTFRALVLYTRTTLGIYQRLTFNRPVSKTKKEVKLEPYYDVDSFQTMEENKVIQECLKTRQMASLQIYSMKRNGAMVTNEQLAHQSELIILANVLSCDWNDIIELVLKLGYRPRETLTAICYESKLKAIRDYLYYHLDLDCSNTLNKSMKNFVDQLEAAYTINISEISNPSFQRLLFANDTDQYFTRKQDPIQSFVEGFDKSKCKYLRKVLDKVNYVNSATVTSNQFININLNIFFRLLNESSDNDAKSSVSDAVELCLIDADYRRLLMQSSDGLGISQDRLIVWIYKWRKNVSLFVDYVTESCDVDLVKSVIDIDLSSDNVIGSKLLDQLILILSDKDSSEYTDIDRHIAKESLVHSLIQYPEYLIARLDQLYATDIGRAKDILMMISSTLSVHLTCQCQSCPLKKVALKESPLLSLVNRMFIDKILANSYESEFPIVFYYLFTDSGITTDDVKLKDKYSTRKAALLQSVITNRHAGTVQLAVDTFNCLMSRDISIANEDGLSSVELDEIVYTALLSGITYNDIIESCNPTIACIRTILTDNNYWNMLKTGLLRPSNCDSKAVTIEQYYEVNLYSFLYRSGIPLSLTSVFVNQLQNNYTNKGDSSVIGSTAVVKKTSISSEPSKESLNFVYYLSLGRPYQAFCNIEKEYSIVGKPGCVQFNVMKDLVKSVYNIALSNIDDRLIIGGCFGLLRLIGQSTELLRCYLTLIRWVIDWHIQINDQCQLTELTKAQLTQSDIRTHYISRAMSLFKFCLSNNSTERKNSRDLLIRQIEEIFIYRLKSEHYKEIKEIFDTWSLVLYFCQMHGAEFSTAILQYYASVDQWLLFLCIAQVFGYSKDQVKEALNQFEDVSIRQHMSYIVNKVDDFSQPSLTKEDPSRTIRTTTDPMNRLGIVPSTTVSASIKDTVSTSVKDACSPTETHLIKDFLSYKTKNHNKYSLSILRNSAKSNLFELIFDCQYHANNLKCEMSPDRDRSNSDIRLNIRKLLAYCLALGHPFLSVLAFSSQSCSDDPSESATSRFAVFLGCVACFIVSSSPKRIQEIIWAKWSGIAKLDWSEEELIDLVVYAIENGFVQVVSQAFAVLKADKFSVVSAFYAMVTNAIEQFNPVLRDEYLGKFVNLCRENSTFVTISDRQRAKPNKNTTVTFIGKLLGTSLVTALEVSERRHGARILHEWLQSMTDSTTGILQAHVKLLFPFSETNISLLSFALSVYLDFFDLDSTSTTDTRLRAFPVKTRSKEFMQFVENTIERVLENLNSCSDYTRVSLAENALSLVAHINSLHSVHLPSNHDKWKSNETLLKSLSTRKVDSNLISQQEIVDLVSMALSGQVDKLKTVSLCTYSDHCSLSCLEKSNSSGPDGPVKSKHGSTNSWRQLVIPEEWQDTILTLPHCTGDNCMEKISHVNCLLNERKWIEACGYMIEHEFAVKDAILILTSMKVACGKMDPSKLPLHIKEYCQPKHHETSDKEPANRLHVRRMSVQMNTSVSKLNLMLCADNDMSATKTTRQSRSNDMCQQFLTKISEILIHGQEMVEYICTIHCVATKMSESYLSVSSGEEFDVLTKILVGGCKDKMDTADMYLGVVDIDTEQLCNFIAEVIVQVLRLEIETYIGSTSVMTSTSMSPSLRPRNSVAKVPFFGLSPLGQSSSISSQSSSPNACSRRSGNTVQSHGSVLSLHENTLRVAERCQLRSEWRTVSAIKTKQEFRLMKAFTLQDILVLSPNSRKLGKILFSHYQRFSQEVSACNEDAEFLVHLLIQCHNCFTDGGDTIGISNCLKAAKELTRLLNSNGYFVLMAQLLCRIGRYGEMPYIFSNLIENHEFEQLFRKDMDKDGIIVPYVFDYLNRYHNNDYEKMEVVCNRYNCYYELAETKSKMANSTIIKLKEHLGANCVKDTAKMLTSTIVNCLLDACKNYLKAGCCKKMEEHFRKAQFYKLQQRWLDDPEKTFASGTLTRTGRLSSGKIVLPETGLQFGVRLLNLNSEQALAFLKKIPNFYTAYLISDQLKLPADIWIELLMHHVLINGDEAYLRYYMLYFGPIIGCNLVQQCLNRLERNSLKLTNKLGLVNLKKMLDNCDDVFFARRITENYKLNN